MYDYKLQKKIDTALEKASLKIKASNLSFYSGFMANSGEAIVSPYFQRKWFCSQ
jgi:hypothetical protein